MCRRLINGCLSVVFMQRISVLFYKIKNLLLELLVIVKLILLFSHIEIVSGLSYYQHIDNNGSNGEKVIDFAADRLSRELAKGFAISSVQSLSVFLA